MPADEVMVDFHVLANKVNGSNNVTISIFLHSLHLTCLHLTQTILNTIIKVALQFKTEGNCQNEIVSHMDRSEVKL